jgi:predicted CopG family antitoxin
MATKLLAIREEVYRKLSEIKKNDESFSDVIEKLLESHGSNLMSLWGAWANGDKSEIEFIKSTVKDIRKRAAIRTQ